MLWHEHPVNEARQARGLQPVNSCWLWGGPPPRPPPAGRWPSSAARNGWRRLRPASGRRGKADRQAGSAMLADLIAPAQVGDWADWLARMQRLEQDWFAPLLAALKAGQRRARDAVSATATAGPRPPAPAWRNANSGASRLTPLLKQS
jgi:hypothetical protein